MAWENIQLGPHTYKAFNREGDTSSPAYVDEINDYTHSYSYDQYGKYSPSAYDPMVALKDLVESHHNVDFLYQLYSYYPNGGEIILPDANGDPATKIIVPAMTMYYCAMNDDYDGLKASEVSYPDYTDCPRYDALNNEFRCKFRAIGAATHNVTLVDFASNGIRLEYFWYRNNQWVHKGYIALGTKIVQIDAYEYPLGYISVYNNSEPFAAANVIRFSPYVLAFNELSDLLFYNTTAYNYYHITDIQNKISTHYCGMDYLSGSYDMGNAVLEEIPVEEDGYVNELETRFSPRFSTNGVGMYLVPVTHDESDPTRLGDIQDIMSMMQEFDISDALISSWVGTDGKEYILSIRWYYGLNKPQAWKSLVVNQSTQQPEKHKLQIGPVCPVEGVPPVSVYYYNYIFASEFAKFTTPELQVPAHFNNYLDFACSYKLYLPYYGFLDIDPNDIVGGTVKVIYNINLFSGSANINVICRNSRLGNKDTKCYSVDCTVGEDIPFTSEMYKSFGVIAAEKGAWAAKTLANGMTRSAGAAIDNFVNRTNTKTAFSNMVIDNLVSHENVRDNMGHNMYGFEGGQEKAMIYAYNTTAVNNAKYAKSMMDNVNNTVQDTLPFNISTPERSGGLTDETGCLDELFPYLLITRPVTVEPESYENFVGVPSAAAVQLNNVSGFTQIRAVAPESIITGNLNPPKYLNEIIAQLQAGVYL